MILWGKCTPLLPNAINVCLHLKKKSQLLSLIKSSLWLRCQRCKWCRATEAWGTLMRRDISNSAVVTKWFMLCDEPLSAYSILNSHPLVCVCACVCVCVLGTHTCSAHTCPFQLPTAGETNILLTPSPPLPPLPSLDRHERSCLGWVPW